jgi:hypothetical protein
MRRRSRCTRTTRTGAPGRSGGGQRRGRPAHATSPTTRRLGVVSGRNRCETGQVAAGYLAQTVTVFGGTGFLGRQVAATYARPRLACVLPPATRIAAESCLAVTPTLYGPSATMLENRRPHSNLPHKSPEQIEAMKPIELPPVETVLEAPPRMMVRGGRRMRHPGIHGW